MLSRFRTFSRVLSVQQQLQLHQQLCKQIGPRSFSTIMTTTTKTTTTASMTSRRQIPLLHQQQQKLQKLQLSAFSNICRNSILRAVHTGTTSENTAAVAKSRTHTRKARPFSSTTMNPADDYADVLSNNSNTISGLTATPVTMFTDDEIMIQQAVRQWARSELLPVVREMDHAACYKPEIIQSLFEQGYMGMEIPVEYEGGSGLTFTAACLTVEEISRVDPSVAILVDIHNTLTNNAIRFWGSKQLQQKWLPRLATNTVSSFCLSEAASGSDAFSMKTVAEPSPDGSYYTIRGEKMWISNAQQAGVFLVFANAAPEKGYKGITAFVVDAHTPGIHVGKPESKLGLRASSTCPVVFDHVQVDVADGVLGEVGQGYKYCIEILNEGRIGIAAQQIGIAKGCMDIAMPYLLERKQFQTALADFQGLQHQYAMQATEIHAASVMTYNACRLKQHKLPFVKEASMCKWYASVVAEKTASKAIEWLGGIGFTTSTLVEKMFRDCKVGSIYEGTSNIQLQTIAKFIKEEYKNKQN